MIRHPVPAVAAVLALGVAVPASGQDLDDLRDELSRSLRDAQFASSFAGLIFLSDELELSGAHYEIDDEVDTELRALALPFRRTLHPRGDDATGIYLEGVAGYARAKQRAADLYGGAIPALATSVETDWTTYGGLAGIGLAFGVGEGVTLTPILNAGLARIENDARYGGPGAAVSARIFDGLAFNWEGSTASVGGALRLDWTRPLGADYELEFVGRHDLRWTETFDADDPAQEFSSRLQLVTLRADLAGPTGLRPFGRPLSWRGTVGVRRFVEGDLLDVRDVVLLGGALELDAAGALPIGRAITVRGGAILGGGISGYAGGVGLSF